VHCAGLCGRDSNKENEMKSKTTAFFGAVATCGGVTLMIIALATNYWIEAKAGTDSESGLWNVCSNGKNCQAISVDTKCAVGNGGNDPYCPNLNATRAFAILSALFGGLGAFIQLITAILSWEQQRDKGVYLAIAGVAAGIIAMAVYVDYYNKSGANVNFSWSFILECVGWILMLLGTIAYNSGTEP